MTVDKLLRKPFSSSDCNLVPITIITCYLCYDCHLLTSLPGCLPKIPDNLKTDLFHWSELPFNPLNLALHEKGSFFFSVFIPQYYLQNSDAWRPVTGDHLPFLHEI